MRSGKCYAKRLVKVQHLALLKSAVAVAVIFHDFGKANILFQQKLRGEGKNNPLANLPAFAQLVVWLILSHHKLPFVPSWKKDLTPETSPEQLYGKTLHEAWFEKELSVHWNSYNFKDKDSQVLLDDNWIFHTDGLPYQSFHT